MFTVTNSATKRPVESDRDATYTAKACAILNAHEKKNGRPAVYTHDAPPELVGKFELPRWAEGFYP